MYENIRYLLGILYQIQSYAMHNTVKSIKETPRILLRCLDYMAAKAKAMAAPPAAHCARLVTLGARAWLELVDVRVCVAPETNDVLEPADALDAAVTEAEMGDAVGMAVGAVGVAPVVAAEAAPTTTTGTYAEASCSPVRCVVYSPLAVRDGSLADSVQTADVVP